MTFEENEMVGGAPVIYIGVRLFQSVAFWIDSKILLHVLMNFLLQVNFRRSQCSHNDIGTRSALFRHIAHGIRHAIIIRVIGRGAFCFCLRSRHDLRGFGGQWSVGTLRRRGVTTSEPQRHRGTEDAQREF